MADSVLGPRPICLGIIITKIHNETKSLGLYETDMLMGIWLKTIIYLVVGAGGPQFEFRRRHSYEKLFFLFFNF